MSTPNSLNIGLFFLTVAAIAWIFIRYPAEQELKKWHAENDKIIESKEVNGKNLYAASPPAKPTRKSSYGFFISTGLFIGALIFFCKAFL